MDELELRGGWNEKRGRLKQRFAELTDDDLTYLEGKEEELIGRLQQKFGKNREEVIKMIKEA